MANVAHPLIHGTPGAHGNEYSAGDGMQEMTQPGDHIPHAFAAILIAAGAFLFFARRSGFVDISVKGSAGGK
jgi:hypothetical protein